MMRWEGGIYDTDTKNMGSAYSAVYDTETKNMGFTYSAVYNQDNGQWLS